MIKRSIQLECIENNVANFDLRTPEQDEQNVLDVLKSNMVTDFLHAIEMTAIACHPWVGKGDKRAADRNATNTVRRLLNRLPIDAKVVIGEGERDKAPMLYIGEQVGSKLYPKRNYHSLLTKEALPKLDIAIDPLEGTNFCARGEDGAISTIAIAPKGSLLHAPDVYMDKIAIGHGYPNNIVDLDQTPMQNVKELAKAKKCNPSELNITILKRDRHEELIAKVQETGAQVNLITDGDVLAIIGAATPSINIDMYMGIGGAPEGVLAAAALQTLGGQMQGRLLIEKDQAASFDLEDINKKYELNDLAKSPVLFVATGITDNMILSGVKKENGKYHTHSFVLHSGDSNIRYIKSILPESKVDFYGKLP